MTASLPNERLNHIPTVPAILIGEDSQIFPQHDAAPEWQQNLAPELVTAIQDGDWDVVQEFFAQQNSMLQNFDQEEAEEVVGSLVSRQDVDPGPEGERDSSPQKEHDQGNHRLESISPTRKRQSHNEKRNIAIAMFVVVTACAATVSVSLLTLRKSGQDSQSTAARLSRSPPKGFESTQELQKAVDLWLAGENSSDTDLAATYGYPIGLWDVFNISDFGWLFSACVDCQPPGRNSNASYFNADLSLWDVSRATTMSNMFAYASAFNSNLSLWDVSGVTDMSYMFSNAESFAGDVSTWDVSNVLNMSRMFSNADAFVGNLSVWDVSNVLDMSYMFSFVSTFSGDLSDWNVSQVINMGSMFFSSSSFNGDVSTWDVSRVTDMTQMLSKAPKFEGDLSAWNVSRVTIMSFMFTAADRFSSDIAVWDVSGVTSMYNMFLSARSFNKDLSAWNVSNVKYMQSMFESALSFNQSLREWGNKLSLDTLVDKTFA